MKTEIYTLRMSRDLKEALESEARREKVSIAALLDRGARQLLRKAGARGPVTMPSISGCMRKPESRSAR